METFKYRLKEVGKTLLTWLILGAGCVLFGWLMTLVPTHIMNWIAYTFLGLIGLGAVWGFIYWLFIEPFRESRKKNKL